MAHDPEQPFRVGAFCSALGSSGGVVPGELGAKCIAELVREAAASADMTVQLWAAGIEPVPEEMRGVRYGAEFIWNARGVAGIASTILNNPDQKLADSNLGKILGPHMIACAARSPQSKIH